MLELKRLKDLQHDNIARFVGASLDPGRRKKEGDMIRDEDPDPLIFVMPDSDPDLSIFLSDPGPTCNNGYLNYFLLEQNINQNEQIQA